MALVVLFGFFVFVSSALIFTLGVYIGVNITADTIKKTLEYAKTVDGIKEIIRTLDNDLFTQG